MFFSGLIAFFVGVSILFGVAVLLTICDLVWMLKCRLSGKPWRAAPPSDVYDPLSFSRLSSQLSG